MSFLDDVASAREKIVSELLETIEVPGWEKQGFTVKVTYKPADKIIVRKLTNAQKSGSNEKIEKADLQFHVDTAVKIEFSKDGETASFQGFTDTDLGDVLQLQEPSAQNAVDKLFIKDGDMNRYARIILEWSGYKDEKADEALLGE